MEERKLQEDAFTIKDYNDKPKPCLESGCTGSVCPTRNVNVGMCNECKRRVSWSSYQHKEGGDRKGVVVYFKPWEGKRGEQNEGP